MAIIEYSSASVRIYVEHITLFQSERRDEPQHIAQLLHGGELPVGAVATAAHGPGDEGTSGHRRPEDDGVEGKDEEEEK